MKLHIPLQNTPLGEMSALMTDLPIADRLSTALHSSIILNGIDDEFEDDDEEESDFDFEDGFDDEDLEEFDDFKSPKKSALDDDFASPDDDFDDMEDFDDDDEDDDF